MRCVSEACGSVVIDDNNCMYTNNDAGLPFDRYVGKQIYKTHIFTNYKVSILTIN